jgi:hypothetical protein
MSAYRLALDLTTRAIIRRLQYYRRLILGTILVGAAAAVAVVLTQSLIPLAGLLLLAPLAGIFFYFDSRVLHDWRVGVLRLWGARAIEIAAFAGALRASPHLPKSTVDGMLDGLPALGDLSTEQHLSTATRQAITGRILAQSWSSARALAWQASGSMFGAIVAIVALVSGHWEVLWGMPIAAIPYVQAWLGRRRPVQLTSDPLRAAN